MQMGEEELADEFEVNMEESRQAVSFAGELRVCACLCAAPAGQQSVLNGVQFLATDPAWPPSSAAAYSKLPGSPCHAACMFLVPLVTGFCVSRLIAEPVFEFMQLRSPLAFAPNDRQRVHVKSSMCSCKQTLRWHSICQEMTAHARIRSVQNSRPHCRTSVNRITG